MNKLYVDLTGVVLGLGSNLNAQTAVSGSFNSGTMPMGGISELPAQPDSIVQITAEAQGLPVV